MRGLNSLAHAITERGLNQKVNLYQHKISEAMVRLGASYKTDLRIVNNPAVAGYDPSVGDVFTEVVRNQQMRNESFIINATSHFLERQPEILFEASSLHEICRVMNDDLTPGQASASVGYLHSLKAFSILGNPLHSPEILENDPSKELDHACTGAETR